jgi:acetyl-CoA carboxylase biotin carboxyl carrier protein
MDLTNEDVADILALLDSLPYDSLDVETPRFRLTLRRTPDGDWTEESRVLAEPALVAPAPNGSSAAQSGTSDISGMSGSAGGATPSGTEGAGEAGGAGQAGGSQATAGTPADANGLAVVAAPLPGTFYRAPRPGADPFVRTGDAVTPDTVVAIVETMKLMNSVHAGTAGRVARICLDNGEFAPVGTTLMLIEPGA